MTTKKQAAANTANAQKSSGPKTAAGKAKSAQNATTHGLTGKPDWNLVTAFYRILLEDPAAWPNPLEQDPARRATLTLAEALAGVRRAEEAERRYLFERSDKTLRKMGSLQEVIEVMAELDLEDMETLDFLIARQVDPWMQDGLRILKASSPKRPTEVEKTLKRLARYRREATARRRKALEQWTSMGAKPETKPFSIMG